MDYGFSLTLYTALISLFLALLIVYLSNYIKPLKYMF